MNISRESVAEFEGVFNLFDANGDGFLTRQEIDEALSVLGRGISSKDRDKLFNRLTDDNLVTRDSFMEWMSQREDLDISADLREIFQLIDVDSSGCLSFEEFTFFSKKAHILPVRGARRRHREGLRILEERN